MSRKLQKAARVFGVLLIVAALAVLANVAWQLWGTGIETARAQHRLAKQFQAAQAGHAAQAETAAAAPATATSSPSVDLVPAPNAAGPASPLGTVVAHLVIPKIGVNYYVVEGVGSSQLAEGPGHYPGTAPVGGTGNVGIAGHRTTHGAPFYNLNGLKSGDVIYLTNTAGRTFVYRVTTQFVVPPSDSAVLNPTPTPTLTLTTCNPRYSATQRLIVKAALETSG